MAVDIPSMLYFDPADRYPRDADGHSEDGGVSRLRRKDGTEVWTEYHGRREYGEDGRVRFREGILRDITERRKADEERVGLEQQLFQAQKMEAIGTMAAGLAHDFNNILGIIMGNAGILTVSTPEGEKVRLRAESITTAAERGAQLVRKLMTFARKTDAEQNPLSLNDVVREGLDLLRATLPKEIAVHLSLDTAIPAVIGDSGQIQQVLINLGVNARDAMPGGGTLTITTSAVPRDTARKTIRSAAAARYVRLEVADTGRGMDEETQRRIFDPFFSTKTPDRGTGLGLAMVSGIIAKHGGHVSVRSSPGLGSEFTIWLPVRERTAQSPRHPSLA